MKYRYISGIMLFFWASQAMPVLHQLKCSPGSTTSQINALLPLETKSIVRLVVPSFLWFKVGSTLDTVDTISFDFGGSDVSNSPYNGVAIGSGTAINANNNPHGLGVGVLPVKLQANCGQVTISATTDNTNGLSNANGQFIGFDQINTTTSEVNLTPPVLKNTGIVPVTVPISSDAVVTDWIANWTYTYKNQLIPLSGLYQGMVTYVASCP